MSDPPRRKKRLVPPPIRPNGKRKRDPAVGKLPVASDLDVETLQALARMSGGKLGEFSDQLTPPDEICDWLRRTDIRHVRGMLLASVRRWLELRARHVGS